MFEVTIKRGTAAESNRAIGVERFNIEFAARWYGLSACREDACGHWTLQTVA